MKRFLFFVGICYAISGCAAGLFYLLGGSLKTTAGGIFAACYMFIPLVSVILTQLLFKDKILRDCGLSFRINWWWLFAWLITPILTAGSVLLSLLFPDVTWSVENSVNVPLLVLLALLAGLTVNAVAAMGEEVAWRGFLVKQMEGKNFWLSALLIGVVWGAWHAPLVLMGLNYPQHPATGVFMMIVLCTLMSPLMLFVRERTGSTIGAAVTHGALNAIAGLSVIVLSNHQELLTGMTGIAGMLMLLLADIFVVILKIKDNKKPLA